MRIRICHLILCCALVSACKPTPRTAVEARREKPSEALAAEATQQPVAISPIGLVEVTVTRQRFNHLRPWEKTNENTAHAMGVYLGNGRVLTLGRMANYATYVEMSLPDQSRTAAARVVKYDDELGLALLTVEHAEDAAIFEGMPELPVGAPLSIDSQAEVRALVRGMEQVNVALEVESADEENDAFLPRLEMRAAKPLPQGLSVGLPVLKDGALVALVEDYTPRNLSLSCINAEFISRFLNESSTAGDSVPVLGLQFTELNDPVFSKYLKLDPRQGGVYVSKVLPGSAAQAAGVREGDVLLAIDGLPLDKLGRCRHPLYGLLGARQVIRSLKPVGQQLELSISRDGQERRVTLPLNRDALDNALFGVEKPGTAPRYIMWGGLLFQPLTETYLRELQNSADNLPLSFLVVKDRAGELQDSGVREVVALTLVIPTPATLGYDTLGFCVVEQVNGQRVTSFSQFEELLDAPTQDGIIELTINRAPYRIYLDRQTVESSNDAIRRRAIPMLRRMGESAAK